MGYHEGKRVKSMSILWTLLGAAVFAAMVAFVILFFMIHWIAGLIVYILFSAIIGQLIREM